MNVEGDKTMEEARWKMNRGKREDDNVMKKAGSSGEIGDHAVGQRNGWP